MGWIVALIVGGIAGWLASMVMNRDNSMGIMLNIIVGCVGSVLGNLLLNQFGIAGSVQGLWERLRSRSSTTSSTAGRDAS